MNISSIRLYGQNNKATVSIEVDGVWYVAIEEWTDGVFSHFVELKNCRLNIELPRDPKSNEGK